MGSNCSEGRGPDLLFRFPLPPFAEPYGQDCYFSYVGYSVFAAIALANIAFVLVVHLVSLTTERNGFLRLVRVVHSVLLCAAIVLLVLGWAAPEQAYIFGVILLIGFMSTGLLWIILGYKTVVRTIINVALGENMTVTSLLGGRLSLCVIIGSILVTYAIEIGTLVTLAIMKAAGNMDVVVIMFRIAAASISLGVAMFSVAAYVLLSKFIQVIEDALSSDVPKSQSPEAARYENLKDIAKRFRISRTVLVAFATISALAMALHAAFLPLFWFVIIIHLMTLANSCLAVFFAVTPAARRRFIHSAACCCCLSATSSDKKISTSLVASDQAAANKTVVPVS